MWKTTCLIPTLADDPGKKNCAEFRDVLYDPAADPGTVRRELEQLSEMIFVQLLQQRGVTQTQIAESADRLEAVRQSFDHSSGAGGEAVQDLQRQ